MKKIKLKFMVVPSFLKEHCEVPFKMKVKILDPHHEYLKRYLGQSGKTMAAAGASFYFEDSIALYMIANGIAIKA